MGLMGERSTTTHSNCLGSKKYAVKTAVSEVSYG